VLASRERDDARSSTIPRDSILDCEMPLRTAARVLQSRAVEAKGGRRIEEIE
jgi:hypothetical protein